MRRVGRVIVLCAIGIGGTMSMVFGFRVWEQKVQARERERQISDVLLARKAEVFGEADDPFGDDGKLSVLLIGLDSRAEQTTGHCDAIQLIEIDRNAQTVAITAVPRGTFSPLPLGGTYLPTDYYVSNACAIGGLEYGIGQIEHILGKKADALVIVGFSEALGIFRAAGLPATETLQWLRHRQTYSVGEPQRAHNHSTFLKTQIVRWAPELDEAKRQPLLYLVYKMIRTDLSFGSVRHVARSLSDMDLQAHPERVTLAMMPPYVVSDMPYDPNHVGEVVEALLLPIRDRLTHEGLPGEAQVLAILEDKRSDAEFVKSAFEKKLWLTFEDPTVHEDVHADLFFTYLLQVTDTDERIRLLSEYVLEMEAQEEGERALVGRTALMQEMQVE